MVDLVLSPNNMMKNRNIKKLWAKEPRSFFSETASCRLYAVRGRRSIVMYGMFLGVFLCVESKSVKTFCGTLLQIPILSKKLENGFSDFAFQSSYFFVRALCVVLKKWLDAELSEEHFDIWYMPLYANTGREMVENWRALEKTEKFEFRAITLEIEEIAFRP